jgi:hypothetical protein
MYHYTNLGAFSPTVEPFTDMDGMVPELGDALNDFAYPAGMPWDPISSTDEVTPEEQVREWCAWVDEAIRATGVASQRLADWQASQL